MSKNQELNELIDTITALYKKNISFISREYKELYTKILEFEKNNNENYKLEFIDNHFEITDSNQNKTYNCNPFFDAQERVKNINSQNCFKLLSSSILKNRINYKNQISAYEVVNEYINTEEYTKNEIIFNKFIFIGTLLGVHLNDIDSAINSKVYLILENNIEIFRLSLFLCDYEQLNKNTKLFFCIQEDINKEKIIHKFLSYKYEFNNYIGFELGDASSLENIDYLTKSLVRFDPLNYPFSEYLCSLKRGYHYFSNSNNGIMNLSKKLDIIKNPVLFLGSGPSISKHIEWIVLNKDKFILACAASVLKRFEQWDIIPDIILSADGQNRPILNQFDVEEKYYKNSIILTSIKTDEEVISKINSHNLYFYQDSLELFSGLGVHTGLTVGDVGLNVLLNLGAKELYMLGFDAAFSKDGQTHDELYKNKKITKETIKNNDTFSSKKSLITVKGNFKKEVSTIILYVDMIQSINEITSNLKENTKIYNLSDGAYFENCKPLRVEEIKVKNKININKIEVTPDINKELKKICKKILEEKDIKEIKLEQKILKKLNIFNQKNMQKEFLKLESSYRSSTLLQIFKKFFLLIKPYSNHTENISLEFIQFRKLYDSINSIYNKFTF